jgi:uncharacterized damage-inducible protein DinB
MNRYVQNHLDNFKNVQSLRSLLTEALTDADLAFKPAASMMTLGALCREMGEVEHAYIESLKTFKQDFSYRHPDAAVETSIEKLRAWYQTLDEEIVRIITAFSDADLDKLVDRDGFQIPAGVQPHIYEDALFIFYGKASIYLRLMGKPLPQMWQEWIA